jgi:glutamine synthetase
VPVKAFDESKFTEGHAFDGSSIAGWKGIEASDMLLMPDPASAHMDPFTDENTLILTCDVVEPSTGKGYDRDPRSIAHRADAYLKASGIGDVAYFGPEPEFFIFDSVAWKVDMSGSSCQVWSSEASWQTDDRVDGQGNSGGRIGVKGGYFPVAPLDQLQDMRSEMCLLLEQQGVEVEVHHHEVANAGQCEIGTKFAPLVQRADWLQILKYTVMNVAHAYGKTATFMPKPIVGDNGSGMHVHQSVWKDGKNLFAGNGYAGLRNSRFTTSAASSSTPERSTPSPTRPPTRTSAWFRASRHRSSWLIRRATARHRSAFRMCSPTRARRIEVRFPDPLSNPYLAFAAMLMAGLDGVQNKIHPGDPSDKNLYDLPPEEMRRSRPCVRRSTRRSRLSTRTASSSLVAACSATR